MYILTDKELGTVFIRINPRATRFTFRVKPDGVYVSMPVGTSKTQLEQAIDSLRDRLNTAKNELAPRSRIDLNFKLSAELFTLSVVEGGTHFTMSSKGGDMILTCPTGTDFNDEAIQEWLRKVIVNQLAKRAKQVLPARLHEHARQHNMPFNSVKITSSRGRWGSCSTQKNINLSCFLMLLPLPLIDYVLLHELCHTIEMNHSKRFWELLNKLCGGKSGELRCMLKTYTTDF